MAKEKFLNVSNHVLTEDQIADIKAMGFEVVELPETLKKQWGAQNPLNYRQICNDVEAYMTEKEIKFAHLAGFMASVVKLVERHNANYFYSFTERVSTEVEVEGKVTKTVVFKHKGWYRY